MLEHEGKNVELEAFGEDFREGLNGLFELLEMDPETPLAPDPSSMGFDERTLEELTPQELAEVRRILFEELGIDVDKLEDSKVRVYQSLTPDDIVRSSGETIPSGAAINVSVYRTNKEQEGVFLQELTFPDNELRWVVGPDVDI